MLSDGTRRRLHFLLAGPGRWLLFLLGLAALALVGLVAGSVLVVRAGSTTDKKPVVIQLIPPLTTPTVRPRPTAFSPASVMDLMAVEVVEHPTPTPQPPVHLEPPAAAEPTSEPVVPLDLERDFAPLAPFIGWPVGGQMTQGFGCTPYYSGHPAEDCPADAPWFHNGVDIATIEGAPIRAAMPGRVLFAGADTDGPACGDYIGYGLSVVIEHPAGWRLLYAHLSRLDVAAGDPVEAQTIIGAVGHTGCASGDHLHFALRYQDELVDPTLYIPNE